MTVHPPSGFRRLTPPARPRVRALLPPGRALDADSIREGAERRIRERPLTALLLALALGLVVGKLVR